MPLAVTILAAFLAVLPSIPRPADGTSPRARPASRFAAIHAPSPTLRSAEDEFELGQLHYARGEYVQAADAFGRAAARLEPSRKPEARYWTGLSWLGAGNPVQARSAFEDVIASSSSRRTLARLGLAQSWDAAGRADRSLEALNALLAEPDLGEAGPAALARTASIAAARGDAGLAGRAQSRLARDYPSSMEAAAIHLSAPPAESRPAPATRRYRVQIGAFTDVHRARALADAARRAGFRDVIVATEEEAGRELAVVMLGPYSRLDEARAAASRIAGRLDVTPRIATVP
jgi:tetratricopeptide (TPR) repeat protein